MRVKVNTNGKGPILMPLPDRAKTPGLPLGDTLVTLPDGRVAVFRFAKIAVNVITIGDRTNRIGDVLRAWFGPDAGRPGGPAAYVVLECKQGRWYARPEGV